MSPLRPPERVAVKMTKGPWMFRAFAGSWRYEEVDARSTLVIFKYHVEARPHLGPISDWILQRVFSREMDARLQHLAMWAATQQWP